MNEQRSSERRSIERRIRQLDSGADGWDGVERRSKISRRRQNRRRASGINDPNDEE